MQVGELVGTAMFCALFGLFLLFMLWPDERQGQKVLSRWGVRTPTGPEVAEAVRYLRRRRFCYPWLFTGLSVLSSTGDGDGRLSWWSIVASLLFGGLVAELLAFRPNRGARRMAELHTRKVTDLVPVWALGLYAALACLVVVTAVNALLGVRWRVWAGLSSAQYEDRPLLVLLIAATSIAVVCLVLLLTVRRPSAGTQRVDTVLRVRSARVAVGIGLAGLGSLVRSDVGPVSLVVLAGCVAGWLVLTAQQRAIPVIAQQRG